MGLLAPPAPGSLLKTTAAKPATPITKKNSGEKPTAKEKAGKKVDRQAAETEEANED